MSATKAALEAVSVAVKSDLEQGDRRVAELSQWMQRLPSGLEAYAAAAFLHHLYGAIEAILERGIKTFDGLTPKGDGFHIQMLEMGAKEIPGIRPAILPKLEAVDALRRFRHRFRKRYEDDFNPALLQQVIQIAVTGWPEIRSALAAFGDFVDECAKAVE